MRHLPVCLATTVACRGWREFAYSGLLALGRFSMAWATMTILNSLFVFANLLL